MEKVTCTDHSFESAHQHFRTLGSSLLICAPNTQLLAKPLSANAPSHLGSSIPGLDRANMLTREMMEKKRRRIVRRSKEKENYGLIYEKREGKLHAVCQSRSPKPSTSAKPSSSAWGQARPMGAGEAGGGRRGRRGQWGRQATGLMPESTSIAD